MHDVEQLTDAELQEGQRSLMAELVAAVAAGAPATMTAELRAAYADGSTPLRGCAS